MFDFLKKKHDIVAITKTPSTKLLAVAYTGKGLVPYFEQADYYEVYVFENGRKVRKQMLSMPVNRVDDSVDLFRKMKMPGGRRCPELSPGRRPVVFPFSLC